MMSGRSYLCLSKIVCCVLFYHVVSQPNNKDDCHIAKETIPETEISICLTPDSKPEQLRLTQSLQRIYFTDGVYDCTSDSWWELWQKFEQKGIDVTASRNSSCENPTEMCTRIDRIDVSRQLVCERDIVPHCSDNACYCIMLPFSNDINLICNTSLTTAELPVSIPKRTMIIQFHNNKLVDMDDWLSKISELENLKVINLEGNMLTHLPNLPQPPTDRPSSLNELHLKHNQIRTLDVAVLRKYQKYYPNLSVSIHGNPFVCDCKTQQLLDYLRQPYHQITKMDLVFCKHKHKITRPWAVDFSKCVKRGAFWKLNDLFIYLLCVANMFVFGVFMDITKALKEARSGKPEKHVPIIAKLHRRYLKYFKRATEPVVENSKKFTKNMRQRRQSAPCLPISIAFKHHEHKIVQPEQRHSEPKVQFRLQNASAVQIYGRGASRETR